MSIEEFAKSSFRRKSRSDVKKADWEVGKSGRRDLS